jgi:hypothetical protein
MAKKGWSIRKLVRDYFEINQFDSIKKIVLLNIVHKVVMESNASVTAVYLNLMQLEKTYNIVSIDYVCDEVYSEIFVDPRIIVPDNSKSILSRIVLVNLVCRFNLSYNALALALNMPKNDLDTYRKLLLQADYRYTPEGEKVQDIVDKCIYNICTKYRGIENQYNF